MKSRLLPRLGLVILLAAGLVAAAVSGQAQDQTNGQSDLVLFLSPSNPLAVAGFVSLNETNASQFLPAFLPAPPTMPNIGIQLYEDASETVVSDQLWVQNGQWYFASDPNLINFATSGIGLAGVLVEDGTPQDVSAYFSLPSGSMQVQSDVVPEPNTIVLVGLGGLTLCTWLRRRRLVGSR